MNIKVDWTFLIQSRIKKNLAVWFNQNKVESYEQAINLLEKNKLPVGTREEVVKHIPARPEINDLLFNSGATTNTVTSRLAKKEVDTGPKSAAEEAADAITASASANTSKPSQVKKRPSTKKRTAKNSASGKSKPASKTAEKKKSKK